MKKKLRSTIRSRIRGWSSQNNDMPVPCSISRFTFHEMRTENRSVSTYETDEGKEGTALTSLYANVLSSIRRSGNYKHKD
jgi:hypothetical protein